MHPSRLSTVLAATFAALAVTSVSPGAAGGLTGTYTATVTTPAELAGTWTLALAGGGAYTVALDGQTVARGTYSSTPRTITFRRERRSGCTGTGTYAWKKYAWRKSGTTLDFVRKRESPSCEARAIVLGHRFEQDR
jgi:hypothetical protein